MIGTWPACGARSSGRWVAPFTVAVRLVRARGVLRIEPRQRLEGDDGLSTHGHDGEGDGCAAAFRLQLASLAVGGRLPHSRRVCEVRGKKSRLDFEDADRGAVQPSFFDGY